MTPSPTTLRIAGDGRLMVGAPYALLLQVAHPVVSAGVAEHSNFQEDPYGRLIRTLDYINVSVFGDDENAAAMGRRTREMHKRIKGLMPDGSHYHSLEPGAFAWVHATLVHSILKVAATFGRPPTAAERETVYEDWRVLGTHIGVRERDLPATHVEFVDYVATMEHDALEDTESARTVMHTLMKPKAPPVPYVTDGVWRAARWPATRAARLSTLGLLGPVPRARLNLQWSRAQQRQFDVLAAAHRAAGPVMPRAAREFGPTYLRYRRDALSRQGFAV